MLADPVAGRAVEVIPPGEGGWHYTIDGSLYLRVTGCLPFYPPPGLTDGQLLKAQDRGKTVHLITALNDRGTLDEDSVDVDLSGYLEGWDKACDDLGIKVIERWIERTVWHPIYGYAGTLDRIAIVMAFDGRLCLVDLKSGPIPPFAALQTAAYLKAVQAQHPEVGKEIEGRLCVSVNAKGGYKHAFYNDLSSDFSNFLCYLQASQYNISKGLPPLGIR